VTATGRQCGVFGVGYGGRSLAEFVHALTARGTSLLVDVRLNPVSRKPGFSKRSLSAALADAGIRYQHLPELGNPPWNRPGFAGSAAEAAAAHARYADLISGGEAAARIGEIAAAAATEVVAVMCVEADERSCHRQEVLDRVRAQRAAATAGEPGPDGAPGKRPAP
jgi:uncharacterized protein (DUF488 family)